MPEDFFIQPHFTDIQLDYREAEIRLRRRRAAVLLWVADKSRLDAESRDLCCKHDISFTNCVMKQIN